MEIAARGLVKVFPAPALSGGVPLAALDGVCLEARPGVAGVEGPNGSGKTTLLKALAGVLETDAGEVLADGIPAGAGRLRELAAYCPANPRSFYFRLSAAENLRFFGALAGLDAGTAAARAAGLAERLGLQAAELSRRFDRLSEGNMQKISLIRAFSRRAQVLLLDEPFRGLDAASTESLLGLIEEAGRYSAVLLSSHSPQLLRRAAGRVLTMRGGRVTGEAA